MGKITTTVEVRGSQRREQLADSGNILVKRGPSYVVLEDELSGIQSIWKRNDHCPSYVIVINGCGYEFVRSINA